MNNIWLNGGNINEFHEAMASEVLCPECGKGFLKIDDILDDTGNLDKRCLYCPECGEKRYQLVKLFEDFINFLKNSEDEL